MLRAAFDPKRWVLAAIALAFAHDVSFAQAPSPPSTPPVQTPAAPPAQTAQTAPSAPAAEPTPAAKEAARQAYGRGQAAFAAGQYDVARSAFEEAFAAVPNPIVLLSVAESHAKLGHVREAAAALHRYLELRPDAPDRAEVEAKLKGLENTPAFVSVTSVPAGAELTIDDGPTTQKAPAQLELTPGKHTLKYSLPGYSSSSELLVVDPGARYDLEIVLQPAPPAEPPPEAAPAASTAPPPPATEPVSPAALWITGGLGAAGIITGTVLGFLALKAKSDYDSMPTESRADSGERLALFADVGFGVGIMALATTAVLLFTNDAPAAKPADDKSMSLRRPAPRASLEITPQLSPTTASATARIRF
jgi:tetratricopeptide (TPR) repeat protein